MGFWRGSVRLRVNQDPENPQLIWIPRLRQMVPGDRAFDTTSSVPYAILAARLAKGWINVTRRSKKFLKLFGLLDPG